MHNTETEIETARVLIQARQQDLKRESIEATVGEIIELLNGIECETVVQAEKIQGWIQDLEEQVGRLFREIHDEPNVGWWTNWWTAFATQDITLDDMESNERAGELIGLKFDMNVHEVNPNLVFKKSLHEQVHGTTVYSAHQDNWVDRGFTEMLIGLLFVLSGLARNYKPGYEF